MGLDQYAYARKGDNKTQICYWRKHANLQGYMEDLYYAKGGEADTFNCVEVELNEQDLLNLKEFCLALQETFDKAKEELSWLMNDQYRTPEQKEEAEDNALLLAQQYAENNGIGLQKAEGFFWGESQPYQNAETLQFIEIALKSISEGFVITYSSWW